VSTTDPTMSHSDLAAHPGAASDGAVRIADSPAKPGQQTFPPEQAAGSADQSPPDGTQRPSTRRGGTQDAVSLTRSDYALGAALGVLGLILMEFLVWLARPGYLSFSDCTPYVLQACIFSNGRLADPTPAEDLQPFFATNGMIDVGGRRFSRQPPGTSALFALVTLIVRDVRLAPPVLSALALTLTWLWIRRAYDRRTAILATAISLLPPGVTILYSSTLSYVPSCLVSAAVMLVFTHAVSRPRITASLLCGLLLGLEFTIRPYTAVLMAIALVLIRASCFRIRPITLRQALAFAGGISTGVILFLTYNRLMTHAWWPLAFNLHDPHDRLGFGLRGLGAVTRHHTPWLALRNLAFTLNSMARDFFCFYAWIIPLAVWWIGRAITRSRSARGRMAQWDWALLMYAAILILGHMAYWWPRTVNYLETVPFFAVLASRGILYMAGGGWRCRGLLCVAALLALATPAVTLKGILGLPDWSACRPIIKDDRPQSDKSLVFVRGPGSLTLGQYSIGHLMLGFFNYATTPDTRVIYAIDRGGDNVHLMARYPDHRPYLLQTSSERLENRESSVESFRLEACGFEYFDTLGTDLYQQGKLPEAIDHYRRALKAQPDKAKTRYHLGLAYDDHGELDKANDEYREVIRLDPNHVPATEKLACVLVRQGEPNKAASFYRRAISLEPNRPDPLNNLAWILATTWRPDARNADEGVRLALRACELTHYARPAYLDTLGAAYASAGNFAEAIRVVQKGIDLARRDRNTQVADTMQTRLDLYRTARPFREPQPDRSPMP
jgi:Tfp pilus assembly protein PilF